MRREFSTLTRALKFVAEQVEEGNEVHIWFDRVGLGPNQQEVYVVIVVD